MLSGTFVRTVAVSLGLAAAALVVTACTPSGSTSPGLAAPKAGSEQATEGQPAPAFTLEDVGGNPISLADSGGRLRLIDFWATWCAPCREEVPMLKDLQETYRDRGLEIVAIADSTDGAAAVRDFVAREKINYTTLLGTDQVAQDYVVLGLPTAYLVDGEGTIVAAFPGTKPRKVLEARIVELLEGKQPG
jgi:peroxiredoxin